MKILKQKIILNNQQIIIVKLKLGNYVNYSMVLKENLFEDMFVTEFIKIIEDNFKEKNEPIELIEEEPVVPDKLIDYLIY